MLVRFILDSHPDFACPSETSAATAVAQLAHVWDIPESVVSGERRPPMAAPTPSRQATAVVHGHR